MRCRWPSWCGTGWTASWAQRNRPHSRTGSAVRSRHGADSTRDEPPSPESTIAIWLKRTHSAVSVRDEHAQRRIPASAFGRLPVGFATLFCASMLISCDVTTLMSDGDNKPDAIADTEPDAIKTPKWYLQDEFVDARIDPDQTRTDFVGTWRIYDSTYCDNQIVVCTLALNEDGTFVDTMAHSVERKSPWGLRSTRSGEIEIFAGLVKGVVRWVVEEDGSNRSRFCVGLSGLGIECHQLALRIE